MATVTKLHPARDKAAVRAEAWEGLVRIMEANGRTHIEVGIDDVRDAARAFREGVGG